MGFRLSDIYKKVFTENETVNSNFTSISHDTGESEQGILVSLVWDNGNGSVDATVKLEGSSDNINFAEIDGVAQQFTDDDGTILFDVIGLNAVFVRVTIEVTTGSFDIISLDLSAKQRH